MIAIVFSMVWVLVTPAVLRAQSGTARTDAGARQAMVFEFSDLIRPAKGLATNKQPAYPEMMRAAGIEATVAAEFVVDTTGVVVRGSFKHVKTEMTSRLGENVMPLSSDAKDNQFSDAVRAAIDSMKFEPAVLKENGRRVRQLVRQSFAFGLNR